jgi:hypothetical protein
VGDGEGIDVVGFQLIFNEWQGRVRQLELADADFDDHLPYRYRAQIEVALSPLYHSFGFC